MGKATIEEGRSLLQWLREDYGHEGPLGVTGVSMGAAMATAIGCCAPFEYVALTSRTDETNRAAEWPWRRVCPHTPPCPSTRAEC